MMRVPPSPSSASARMVMGCMTGTSIDGLDATLLRIRATGLLINAEFIGGLSVAIPQPLAQGLRAMATGTPHSAAQIAHLAVELGELHSQTCRRLAAAHQLDRPDLVCLHGQTVIHAPPRSWQLLNPHPVAHTLGVPVVFDLRAADLAAGGQGAPITPLADFLLFSDPARSTAIVNLGGFCNITILPPRPPDAQADSLLPLIRGMDVCACNQLLDHLARTLLHTPFDHDGHAAASGTPDPAATHDLRTRLDAQSTSRRSLGTGDELSQHASTWLAGHQRLSIPDLLASASHAIAQTIARTIASAIGTSAPDPHPPAHHPPPHRVVLAGGGIPNRALLQALARHCATPPVSTGELGIPPEFREAACMAILGALCHDHVPITLPQVTGCRTPAPVAGIWVNPPS